MRLSDLLVLGLLLVAGSTRAAGVAEGTPYVLEGAQAYTLRAPALGRDYEIDVSLPPSYGQGDRRYPVVFVTDSPYAFPLTQAIEGRISRHSKALPEFILVGLGYAKGETGEYSRRRDYTPTSGGDPDAVSDMLGRPVRFGEAEGYRRFVAEQVFPFIAAHFRADMSRKVFAGHSYGSLFGAWVMCTAPEMFDGYVLGSPSLWFDDHAVLARERAYAAAHRDLRARVYVGAGELEGRAPPGHARDPRYSKDVDMVADAQAFSRTLAARRYPGLRLRTDVIAGENHLSVAPALITRGLLWTLGNQ